MQSSLTQFNSHNVVQVFLQGKDKYDFIVRPLIGGRKVPLVSRQHQEEIKYMNFISNDKILVIFKFGKVLCYNDKGDLVFLKGLDLSETKDTKFELIAESELTMDNKSILLEFESK